MLIYVSLSFNLSFCISKRDHQDLDVSSEWAWGSLQDLIYHCSFSNFIEFPCEAVSRHSKLIQNILDIPHFLSLSVTPHILFPHCLKKTMYLQIWWHLIPQNISCSPVAPVIRHIQKPCRWSEKSQIRKLSCCSSPHCFLFPQTPPACFPIPIEISVFHHHDVGHGTI